MRTGRDDLDRFLHQGVDVARRLIYLGGLADNDWGDTEEPGIGWSTSRRFICSLIALDDPRTQRPITVVMNSGGGDWGYGMAIYDAIQHCVSPVVVLNLSYASSMTSIILQAGDYRITAPHSHCMIHDGHLSVSGTPRSVESSVVYDRDVVTSRMYEVYLGRLRAASDQSAVARVLNAKLPKGARRVNPKHGPNLEHVAQLCSTDTFFTADEMVACNFADRLLEVGDLAGAHANPRMRGLIPDQAPV